MFAVRSLQWSRQPAARRRLHPTDIDLALMRGRTTSLDAMPSLPPQAAKPRPLTIKLSPSAVSSLQVVPLALILLVFFLLPTTLFLVVSFFDYDRTGLYPAFMFDNYRELLTSPATLRLYGSTLKFAVIVWAITLFLGFNIAYFLIFHVRSNAVRVVFLLLCAIPFLTSAIIRTIAWIPFLGRNGAFNQALMTLQLTSRPLDFLLFSDFAVIVSLCASLYLVNDRPDCEFACEDRSEPAGGRRDAGASRWQTMINVVIPLSKTGIALGSILVVTQVMGDYFVVRQMSGGQSASIVSALSTEIQAMQYPPAAANAMVLVVVVAIMVTFMMRVVDVRKELVK